MKRDNYIFNTHNQWGLVSRILHWSSSLLIIGMLAVGFYMADYADPPFKYELYGYHKSLGVLLLFLIIFRFIWRLSQPVPGLQPLAKPFNFMMKASPYVLYFLMLAMPLSGIVMSQAGGHPISIFGWVEVPKIISKNQELSALANKTHDILGWVFVMIISLHLLAALFHQFILKDDMISRMWKSGKQ